MRLMRKTISTFICFLIVFAPLAAQNNTESNTNASILPIPNKYNWNDLNSWKKARQTFHHNLQVLNIYQVQKQSKTVNFLKSMVMPGWGHLSSNELTRGEVLLGLEIFLAGSALYFHDKSSDYFNKYKKATDVQSISQYYTDANSAYQNYQALLGLMFFVWGYSALDSFRATATYNSNLWNKLSVEYKGKTLKVEPFRLNLRF